MVTPTDTIDDSEHHDAAEVIVDVQSQPSVASGKRVALVGRFGGMNQREAANVLRSYEAMVVDLDAELTDWVVIGAEEPPIAEDQLLSPGIRDAAAEGDLEILHETELWQRLGLVDVEQSIRRYHTPAMLAHLLGVSVRVIRRWHRRGLITPVRTLHNLPYFDFQEVATARRLAQWIASGASPKAIEQRLVELLEVLPDIQRPLDQLSVLIEGKQVLLRQGEGLVEPGGQLRFDFDAMDQPAEESATDSPPVLAIWDQGDDSFPFGDAEDSSDDELLVAAYDAEDIGDLETAVDFCHAILARDGPRSDIDFQLGELLYRMGHVMAARERYYSAIELDPDFVEARASLGCVLAETGQAELAVAAFRGALTLYEDYSDVHYNLARVLEETGRDIEARHHWSKFLKLAPDSPWAAEAVERIDAIDQS
ncbi:MAG: MerR family transcriptional regulator [Rubripirellula sp.]